jgi:hypothetical protein
MPASSTLSELFEAIEEATASTKALTRSLEELRKALPSDDVMWFRRLPLCNNLDEAILRIRDGGVLERGPDGSVRGSFKE